MNDQTPNRVPVPGDLAATAHINAAKYNEMYKASVDNPDAFWGEHGKRIDWITPYTKVKNTSFDYHNVSIKWFEDGELNVSANCIDRHLAERGDDIAILFEGDEPGNHEHITYKKLHEEVCRFANVLKELGVEKGDRVVLYMPMIPAAAYSMLACARIGAIHSVVFGGFSPDALADRVNGCDAKVVITADEGPRGGRKTPLKGNVDKAMAKCGGDVKVLMVTRTGADVAMRDGRDFRYEDLAANVSAECEPVPVSAEHPLFILYTSGSTGKPKGVVHTSGGGYLVYASMTHEYVFDYKRGDIFWCTADVGWVTGHSYIVYGPLANGATSLMFEGVPTYPDAGRCWQVCETHKVTQFYTAPTAIRALMGQGDDFVTTYDLSSLRILGTVGEPINPEAWRWYNDVVGKGRCPIVDTWWQTETGGHLITPLPGAIDAKPGSATMPFFGVQPVVLDPQSGTVVEGNGVEGVLAIADSWPAQMRTVWGDHDRFVSTYFEQYKGYYFSGDG
ncbi:MAG: acetate--CoA ligase, partial [Pseudomonadota bacterium]